MFPTEPKIAVDSDQRVAHLQTCSRNLAAPVVKGFVYLLERIRRRFVYSSRVFSGGASFFDNGLLTITHSFSSSSEGYRR
jgi:hypothetical protein